MRWSASILSRHLVGGVLPDEARENELAQLLRERFEELIDRGCATLPSMQFSLADEAARREAGTDVVDALLAAVAMTDAVRPDDVTVSLDRDVPRVACTLAGVGLAERSRFERALRAGLPVQFEVEVRKQTSEEDQIVGVVIDALQEGRDDEAHALLEEQRERGDEARLKEAVAEEIRRRGLPIW